MSSYDWGLTPAPQQSTPPPSSGSTSRNPKKLIVPIAVVAVVALVLGAVYFALTTFLRPSSTGPLGWDADTVAHHFDFDDLRHCQLGSEFYESAGLKDVSSEGERTMCSGWTVAPKGQPSVKVSISTADGSGAFNENTEVEVPGLEKWREEYSESSYLGQEATCRLTTDEPGLDDVSLKTRGWCDALYPLAQQLTNLARQNEFILDDPGFFDGADRPTYVEVQPHTYDAYAGDWSEAIDNASPTGEVVSYGDRNFTGNTFSVNEIIQRESTEGTVDICAETTFTLGEKESRWSSNFTTPSLSAYLPDSSTVSMDYPQNSLSLEQGESINLTFCGTLPEGIRDVDAIINGKLYNGYTTSWADGASEEDTRDA